MRRQLIVLWASMLASLAIYCGMVMFFSQSWETPAADPMQNPVVLVLGAAAAGSLALSFVIPRNMMSTDRSELRMRSAYVTRWALLEGIAIFGLLAAFITADVRVFFAFAAVSIAGMLLAFPRDESGQTPQRAM